MRRGPLAHAPSARYSSGRGCPAPGPSRRHNSLWSASLPRGATSGRLRLACERSEQIAAVVSLAGAVDPATCHPAQRVSVLTVHGTADPLVQYGGGSSGFLGTYVSAEATLAFWAKANGCTGAKTPGKPLHLTCNSTTAETTDVSYAGCPAGIGVEHWQLEGIGHVPNFALPAWPEAVLDFLWAHPKVKVTK